MNDDVKKMTNEEAIWTLENGAWWDSLPDDISDADKNPLISAIELAVDALKGHTGEPLKIEQLLEMDGQPVWVEFEDGSGGLWGIVHIAIFSQIVFANGMHCTIGKLFYGRTYKAYSMEQRLKARCNHDR